MAVGRGWHAKRAGAFHSNVYEGYHNFPNFRDDNTHVSFVNRSNSFKNSSNT